MLNYILGRILQACVVPQGITLAVFLILHLSDDPVQLMVPTNASQTEIERLREELGCSDPLFMQYVRFLDDAPRGDFGQSYNYNLSALEVVLRRLPAILHLTAPAFTISLALGIAAGIAPVVKQNSPVDCLIQGFILPGRCIPTFWLGITIILTFSVHLKWFPSSDNEGWKSIPMPAVVLGVFSMASITRLLHSNMLEVLSKEYIDVAKAKGLPKRLIILKRAFKNALSSLLTVLALQLVSLMGGSVIIETAFGWPGTGCLAVQSVQNSDFTVVLTIVVLIAVGSVLISLTVDILYAVINPRVRLQ